MKYFLAILFLLFPLSVIAQDSLRIQQVYGNVSAEKPIVVYSLPDMQAGTTLYVYAESNDMDTTILLSDTSAETVLAANDDINSPEMDGLDNYNSAFKYVFTESGDYLLSVTDCCDEKAVGEFRLLVGINAPRVITGNAETTGDELITPLEESGVAVSNPVSPLAGDVQSINGVLEADSGIVFYDIWDLKVGQTIYIYAESSDFDTYVSFGDIDFVDILAEDDDAGGGTNSALSFEIEQNGDYTIAISDCCNEEGTGQFTILVGIDVPEVMLGEAQDTGAYFAVLYETDSTSKAEMEIADCSQLYDRPILSGPELTRETTNFVIHYTDSGRDGATPNFVDEVERIVEQVLDFQINQMGWPLPPPDCGEGGDDRFDVYLVELVQDGYLGYAQPEGLIGDNPNSANEENYAAYSFLVIDNNFAGVPSPRPIMRATVAHEFHHNIQQGYDLGDSLNWYYEATSTWMETQTFTDDEDATPYTVDLFQYPDVCVGSSPDSYSNRIYAEWTLIDNLARDHGVESIQTLWQYVADYEGMDVFYEYLAFLNVSPQDVLKRFAVRNLLLDYALGERFPDRVRVEANINGVGRIFPRENGVQELGTDYLLLRQKGIYTFTLDQPDLEILVVGIDQPNDTARVFELAQRGTVDTTQFTHAYVLIFNPSAHDNPDTCTYTDWSITVEEGTGQPLNTPLEEIFDASKFIPAG